MDFVYFDLSDQCDPAPDGDGRAKLIRRVEQYVHGHKDTHMANQACIAHRGNKKDLGGGGFTRERGAPSRTQMWWRFFLKARSR